METHRLIIRPFRPTDREDFFTLIRDKMCSQSAPYDSPFPTDEKGLLQVLSYFAGSDEFFAVELKEEGKVIGFLSLNRVEDGVRNLGFCIHSAYQGNGYAKEAAAKLLDYAKAVLCLRRLVSGTAEANRPAVALLTHLGFNRTGTEQASFAKDEAGDPIIFTACSFARDL